MKRLLACFAFCIAYPVFIQTAASQCDGRYQDQLFEHTTVTEVQFGENMNSSIQLQQLYMDVYEPTGDVEDNRPLILLSHGGAFLDVIDHKSADVVRMCRTFSKMGYVCASFDYREEANALSLLFPDKMIKAVFRAVQDGKAAIRYFKRSAEEGNPFRIDPDQIILGGVSAGAILAVNLVYVTNKNMLPWPWDAWLDQVGGLDGNTGNPGYDTDVIGLISISGAIGKAAWMSGNNVPLLSIHGTEDPIVPYGVGKPLGLGNLPTLFGSSVVHREAQDRDISSRLITYEGLGHVPFFDLDGIFSGLDTLVLDTSMTTEEVVDDLIVEEIWDSTIRHITQFAYSLLDCNPDNQIITGTADLSEESAAIFPNPSTGDLNIRMPEGFAEGRVDIYNATGARVTGLPMTGRQLNRVLDLPAGWYTLVVSNSELSEGPVVRKWMVVD